MPCNIKDITLSFLYMDSLYKRGLLKNTTPEMRNKMIGKGLEKLKELSLDRQKFLTHRKQLNKYPTINFISKDYVNFVNFEEAYSTPLAKAGGLIETLYDIDVDIDTSVMPKNENTSSVFVPSILNDDVFPDYPNRDETIVTMMNGKSIFMELHKAFKNNESFELFDLSIISEELKDANISHLDFADMLSDAVINMDIAKEEDTEALKDEAYLPIRIDNKAILGEIYYKESLANLYMDKMIKYVATHGLRDTVITDKEVFVKKIFEDDTNRELISNAVDKAQMESDKYFSLFSEEVASKSLKEAKKYFQANYSLQPTLRETFGEIKKGVSFELDCINKSNAIQLIPTGNSKNATVKYIEPYLSAPTKDDPSNFKKHKLIATKIVFKNNISTTKTSVEIKELAKSELDIPLNKERNVTKAKAYKIEANFPEQFDKKFFETELDNRRTMIIDEADQGAGGQAGDILTYITGKFGSKINVATGTPINGYPESSVNILKLGGNMNLESVQKSQDEFQRLYGVYAVESRFLTLLVHGMDSYGDLSDSIKSTYSNIKTKEKNKSQSVNIDSLYEEAVKKLANMLVEKDLLDKETAMNMDIYKEKVSIKIFFDAIEKSEKENRSLDFSSIARSALVNTPALTKRVPKISSLQGFANTFMTVGGGESISSTDAGVKKELKFLGADVNNINFNKKDPKMNSFIFKENNRSGVRVAQSLLKQYAMMRFTNESYVMLTQNYNNMMRMFASKNTQGKNLRLLMLEEIKHETPEYEISESELLTMMNKTTTSSSDSFADFYKSYLRNNGDFGNLKKEGDGRHEDRLNLFRFTLKLFTKFMEVLPSVYIQDKELQEKERFGKSKNNSKEVEVKVNTVYSTHSNSNKSYDFTGVTYKYMPTFIRGETMYNVEELLINTMGDYGCPINALFSVNIDLCPEDLMEFIEPNDEGKRIPYRFELVNKEENQILDVLGSLGIQKQIKEQILSGANVVNFSQRVFTNGIATLNYLSALNEIMKEYKSGDLSATQKHIVEHHIKDNSRIIVNHTSDGGDRFNLKKLYENIIQQDGIEILPTKREVLDSVTKKSVMYDNKNVSLYSHYRSVSRGFALDYMHKTISLPNGEKKQAHTTLNFIDPVGGGDGIQALSRLESPKTDKNIVSLFNGGNDARLLFFGEDANKILSQIIPSVSDFKDTDMFALHKELSEVISELISMPKQEADEIVHKIAKTLDLPMPFGISEISLNGRKAKMATETYNSVMEGATAPLPEEEIESLYIKKPVIDISLIPDEDDEVEENKNIKDEINQEVQEILNDIDEVLGLDISKEPFTPAQIRP